MVKIKEIDKDLIFFSKKIEIYIAKTAIFIVFFWFGILKVFGLSPANPLVSSLLEKTLPFITFSQFIIFFGIFECIIAILFVTKGTERVVMPLLLIHMLTTIMPLILLPTLTWSGFLIPTLEGQYIIKNLVIIALAIGVSAHLHRMK